MAFVLKSVLGAPRPANDNDEPYWLVAEGLIDTSHLLVSQPYGQEVYSSEALRLLQEMAWFEPGK